MIYKKESINGVEWIVIVVSPHSLVSFVLGLSHGLSWAVSDNFLTRSDCGYHCSRCGLSKHHFEYNERIETQDDRVREQETSKCMLRV